MTVIIIDLNQEVFKTSSIMRNPQLIVNIHDKNRILYWIAGLIFNKGDMINNKEHTPTRMVLIIIIENRQKRRLLRYLPQHFLRFLLLLLLQLLEDQT